MATKQKQTRAERRKANKDAWARMTDDEKKADWERKRTSGRPEPRSAPSNGESRRDPANSSADRENRRRPSNSSANGRRPAKPPPPLDVTLETVRAEANGDGWYVDDPDLAERRARAYQVEAVKGGRFHEPYVISRTCICARPIPLRERWDYCKPSWRCLKCGRSFRRGGAA